VRFSTLPLSARSLSSGRVLNPWWGLAVICLVAFVAIALLANQVFEHVPHSEDEVAYVFQAKVFAQNRLSVPTPPLAEAFWTPFVVDYQGQRFSLKYPIGWSLLLSLGIRLGAPWLINTLLGSLTLGLIAWLGHCFYGHDRGYLPLAAAGLGLATPGFLFLSSSLLSHAASLLWATLTLLALYYLTTASTQKPGFAEKPGFSALLAGLCLGLTLMTRPFAAIAFGAVVGIFSLSLILRGELHWTALLWLAIGGAIPTILLMAYWQTVAGDPLFNPYLLVWPYDRAGFGPDVGPRGYYLSDGILINTRLKLIALATGLFGWPGWGNLLFLPLPFIFPGQADRWDWLLLATIVSLVIVYIFYWSFGGADGGFPRYYYEALPAFLLLTIRGIQLSSRLLSRWGRALRWLPVGVVLIFIAYNLIWNLPPHLAAQKGKYDITPAPLQAVEQARLPKPALVLVKGYDGWEDFAALFAANSPTLDGPVVYAIDWGPEFSRQVRAHFAERSCWELDSKALQPCPALEETGGN
jgi:hypothetical protein